MTTREKLPQFLTIEEVMQVLRCSRSTVNRYIADKKLETVKIGPRMVRVTRESLERLLEGQGSRRAKVLRTDPFVREQRRAEPEPEWAAKKREVLRQYMKDVDDIDRQFGVDS